MDAYQSAVEYLYHQLPMFQRIGPKVLKYDLSNITRLCAALDNPQCDLNYIHIAGTNGKGSVCHTMASILQETGQTVGLYTSPHYRDYRERIRVAGQMIDKVYVVDFVKRIRTNHIIEKIKPTFFELTFAMALCYYRDMQVDIVILETGLGGRLDSTNIVTPVLSIITNIGLDHQATLGDTLPEIAGEKAGIIKPNVPVIIGEYQEPTVAVFQRAAHKVNAPLTYANEIIQDIDFDVNDVLDNREPLYKYINTRTAIAGVLKYAELTDAKISQDTIKRGVKNIAKHTGYCGRWQVLSDSPRVIADAAHNEAGMSIVTEHLKTLEYNNLHIVLGMVGDKPLDKVLKLLPTEATYYFVKADVPRGKPARQLANDAMKYNLTGDVYDSVTQGLESAKANAHTDDLVIVIGSIFTVAEVV